MARQFTDGGEAGDTLQWDLAAPSGGNVTGGRISGRAYQHGSSTPCRRSLTPTSEGFFRIAIKRGTSSTSILGWNNGSTELISTRFNTTSQSYDIYIGGSLQASGAKVLVTGVWYCIEVHFKIDDSNGIVEVKVDGVLDATYSGDTQPASLTTVDIFALTANATGSAWTYDDLAFNDISGVTDNSWCGDAHIYGLVPNGNGDSSQLTGSDGNTTDNYALVDEIPTDGDTTYVESATSGYKDLYTIQDLPALPSGSTIKRVIVETLAKETTAGPDAINLGVKSGVTELWSSSTYLATSYAKQLFVVATDPDTSVDWTEDGINAMQSGVKIV